MRTIINSKASLTEELCTEDCDDCYLKICFPGCYCVAQMINVISQIIKYYPNDNLVVNLESGNTVTGIAGSLFPTVGSGLFQLVDSKGVVQEAVSICKIVSIAVTSAAYNKDITYNPAPDEQLTGCDANCQAAIEQYLSIGLDISIKAGGQTVANGIVEINVYGMIVVTNKNNNNPVFISTCKVESIK